MRLSFNGQDARLLSVQCRFDSCQAHCTSRCDGPGYFAENETKDTLAGLISGGTLMFRYAKIVIPGAMLAVTSFGYESGMQIRPTRFKSGSLYRRRTDLGDLKLDN